MSDAKEVKEIVVKNKSNAGRPKSVLDLDEFEEGWKTIIIQKYSDGAADIEIFRQIHAWRGTFSNDLWGRWMKEEPEFIETIELGRKLSEAWWTEQGRIGIVNQFKGASYNASMYIFQMKNRFRWTDKTEITGADNTPLYSGIEVTLVKPKG